MSQNLHQTLHPEFGRRQFYKPQPAKSKDYRYKAGVFGFLKGLMNAYPARWVQGDIGEIEDQGQTNSCVGHMVSSMLETLVMAEIKQASMTIVGGDLSRLSIYYWARWRTQTTDQDNGCFVRDALDGVNDFGVLPEREWPFNPTRVLDKPNRTQGDALPIVYEALDTVAHIKQALCAGKPVGLAFNVPDDVFDAPRGYVAYDAQRLTNQYHAVRIYGYTRYGLLFKNSWGKSWGRNGCGVLAWDFVTQGAVVDVTSVVLKK